MRSLVLAIAVLALTLAVVPGAGAHRSGCHRWHSCPSDHATYTWQGKRCVKPSSDKRTPAFKRKVKHAGLIYYCK